MSEFRKEMVQLMAHYGHVGITLVAAIFIGLGGGIFVDQKIFHGRTAPWFTFIGLAFGIVAGFKNLLEILWKSKGNDDTKEDGDEKPDGRGNSG